MKCPNCNANITELDEVCPHCKINLDDYEKKHLKNKDCEENKNNPIAVIIKVIAVITLIIGIIWSFKEESLIYFILNAVSFSFIFGFGEIIQKSENIENNQK